MFPRVAYFIICAFLFSSPPAFSEQSFLSGRCKRIFNLFLFQSEQTVKKSSNPVEAADSTTHKMAEKLKATESKPQGFTRSIDQKESEEILRLEKELKKWGSKQIKKRLGEEELKIPKETREEETLKTQGFSSADTKGMNEMSEMIAVGRQLRERDVEPYETHIDYFANKIKEYIHFMEEGAVNLNQRRKLELLREYAEIAINEKSVTYEKWIQFNGMLAEALGRKSLKVSASLEELIKDFPTIILMPTTKGKVGFITISEGIDSNVYILGLSNKQEIKYDGVTGDSLDLFNHDLFHIKRTLDAKTRINHNFYRKMREVRKQIKNLPSEKRKSMELIYWFLVYEEPHTFPYPLVIQTDLMNKMPAFYKRHNKKGAEQIPRIVDDFMEIYTSI